MPLIIPLQPTPSQTVFVTLNNQPCQIDVYQKATGVFVDLYLNDELTIGGVIAENNNVIVRSAYLGFIGDLAFVDTGGDTNPTYIGLGGRYVLAYYLPSELPSGVQ
jgi:hypothetical protein